MIRKMTAYDADGVADIHCEALKGDFLPKLGNSFLKTLYKCMLTAGVGFGVVFEEQGKAVGAAVATEDSGRFYKVLILKCFWSIVPKATWSFLKNPLLLGQMIETLLFARSKGSLNVTNSELLLLALRKAYRRKGAGKKILKALNDEFIRRNIKNYMVRLYDENTGANIFYKKSGFIMAYSYKMYDRKWNVYHYMLENNS
jgi:GNAT superfamily N-acetyltransferase